MRYVPNDSRGMGFKCEYSKYQDVYDAIRSDDWRKLIGFIDSSPAMIRIICDAKPKEPLINILIAYNYSIDLVLDVIDELEPEDLEAKNFNGDTALHVAASLGHIKIAKALVDKNIELVNSINLEGETPLLKAALNGERKIFWKLFYMGSRIKARRSDGATALHCAVMANHFELAYEILIKNPDLIGSRDQLGLTVLHHMVSIPDAFRSGCHLSPLDALLYKCVIVEKSAAQVSTEKEAEEDKDELFSDDEHLLLGLGDLEYSDHTVESILPSEIGEMPRQRISVTKKTHGGAPKSGDDGDIIGGHRRSNVNNNKNLFTTLVRWTRRLVNKIKTTAVILPEKTSKRKSNEGKRPQLDADEGDEEDPHPSGYHQVGHHPSGMGQSHSKQFRLLELHDEAYQPNGFIKLLKPYERWIRRQITYVMVLTHYKKELIDLKKKHKDAIKLLSFIAKNQEYWWSLSRGSIPESHLVSDQKHDKMMERWMETPLTLGAIMGLDELVLRIIDEHPAAATFVGKEGKNLFHVAVENRREYIVDMLDWMGSIDPRLPDRMKSSRDNNGNTILHLAAMPNNQQSSPMQMLEEFKWFEKVKDIVPKDLVNHRNKEGKTAKELFTESHVSMVEDAKTQLTNTARSCCAALVSAVMFAAGFSIANGNEKKGKEGTSKIAYKIFSHTYIFGLSCTATTLVQFMALLMASYKEEDFRRSLPTQYVLALVSLFTAMVAMLVAFACNTYISLYDQLSLDWRNYYLPVTAEIFLFPLICLIILRCRGVNLPFFTAFLRWIVHALQSPYSYYKSNTCY